MTLCYILIKNHKFVRTLPSQYHERELDEFNYEVNNLFGQLNSFEFWFSTAWETREVSTTEVGNQHDGEDGCECETNAVDYFISILVPHYFVEVAFVVVQPIHFALTLATNAPRHVFPGKDPIVYIFVVHIEASVSIWEFVFEASSKVVSK